MSDSKLKRTLTGTVTSDKMEKTVSVLVESLYRHPKYGKVVKRRTKFMAHDEDKRCHVGDKVKIIETRPLSKTKHWKVMDILESMQVKG